MAAMTPEHIAKVFKCTVDQARAQLLANAKDMRNMAEKAKLSKDGKYRGYTLAQLETYASDFETSAQS
jgi:hypothetical protein